MEEAQPQPAAQHLVGGGRLVHLAQRLASGPGDIAIQGEQRVPFRGREVLQVDAPVADVGREALHVLRNPDETVCQPAGEELHLVERARSEEHTSELQSLMRISYAVFCLKKKKNTMQ